MYVDTLPCVQAREVRERESERDRETERERETQRETERQTDRETEIHPLAPVRDLASRAPDLIHGSSVEVAVQPSFIAASSRQ